MGRSMNWHSLIIPVLDRVFYPWRNLNDTYSGITFMKRKDHEQPPVISRSGWKYHHLGIPTSVPHPGEQHLKHLKLYVSGFDTSPYWVLSGCASNPGCRIHELIRTVPHIAFEVDDIEKALKGSLCWVISVHLHRVCGQL